MSKSSIFRQTKALSEFYKTNPLDFKLLDDEGKQALFILSSDQDQDSPGKTHHLFIANKAEQTIQIVASERILPSSENYHFELRFRPGILSNEHFNWVAIGNRDWRSKAKIWTGSEAEANGIEEGSISIYLLYIITDDPLLIKSGDTILLPLDNIKANIVGGSRGTSVELRYHLAANHQIAGVSPATDELKYLQEHLEIINYYGIKNITLDATFLGSNTILNDGDAANNLSLQLTNMDRIEQIPLCARNSENPTKFILYFDTSERAEAWALCDNDNALAIDISLEMPSRGKEVYWHIQQENQGLTPRWILTVEDDIQIDPFEHFFLHLKGIISVMPSGFTNLHLSYENVPGFWDGKFIVAIEKSPVKIKDTLNPLGTIVGTRVGIGTTTPEATLEVNGDIKARKLVLKKNLSLETVDSESVVFTNSIRGVVLNGSTEKETIKITAADGKIKASELDIDAYTLNKVGNALLLSGGQLTVQGKIESGTSISTAGALKTGSFSIEQTTDGSGKKFLQVKDDTAPTELSGFVPKGCIVMWTGNRIPNGWALCDGLTNNTPDLRSRFIVGSGQGVGNDHQITPERLKNYPLDSKGGEQKHKLTTQEMPSHSHRASSSSAGSHKHWMEGMHANGLADRKRTISGTTTVDMGYGGGSNSDPNKKTWRGHVNTDNHNGHSHPITVQPEGGVISHNNLPPYYALAFIMKL